MKTRYYEGYHWVKFRGRGVCRAYLKKNQAKALFDLLAQKSLEIEGIEYDETGGKSCTLEM